MFDLGQRLTACLPRKLNVAHNRSDAATPGVMSCGRQSRRAGRRKPPTPGLMMRRTATPSFESFDPDVLEAARDVARRAGVPLETWIASVVPPETKPGTRKPAAPKRRRADPPAALMTPPPVRSASPESGPAPR